MLNLHFAQAAGMALIALTACTKPFDDTTVKALDETTAKAASVAALPARLQTQLWQDTQTNTNLCNYLRGRPFDLQIIAAKPSVSDLANAQASAGAALETYMRKLTAASAGKSLAELEQAAAGFTASVAETGAQAGLDPAPLQAADILVGLAGRLGEHNRQRRIREIMYDMVGPLSDFEVLLRRDADRVTRETRRPVPGWERSRRCVLRAQAKTAAAPEALSSAIRRRTEIERDLKLIAAGPDIIGQLRKSHILISTSKADLKEALHDMIDLLTEIEALNAALKTEETKP